jgi:type IV pilus assembly protein PilX
MGLTTMKTSNLQEKMSGSNADKALAFQATELALRDAESHILRELSATSPFGDACVKGLCLPVLKDKQHHEKVDWDGAEVAIYGSVTKAPALGGVRKQPSYIIELLPDMPPPLGESVEATATGTPYRITAIGYGKQESTRVMLQSTFYKP